MNAEQAAFAKALTAFQADMPAVGKDQTARVKTKQGGEYSYSYTDLSTIVAKVLPLLAKHGLAWQARPTLTDRGFVLAYSLLHVDGHREDGEYPLPDPSQHTPQEIGSAITYARRYALCAETGIAPGGEDDDGQTAANTRAARRSESAPSVDDVSSLRAEILGIGKRHGWGVKEIEQDFADETDGSIATASADVLADYRDGLARRLNGASA